MSSAFFVNPPPTWLNVGVNTVSTSLARFIPKVICRIIDENSESSLVGVYRSALSPDYSAFTATGVVIAEEQILIDPSQFGTAGDVLTIDTKWAYSLNGNTINQFRLTINGTSMVSAVTCPNNIADGEVSLTAVVTVGNQGEPVFVNGSSRSLVASGALPQTSINIPSLGVTPISVGIEANMTFAGLYHHVLTTISVVRS